MIFRLQRLLVSLLSVLFLVGCGSDSSDETGTVVVVDDGTGTAGRIIRVNHNIANRQVGPNVAGFLFQGMNGNTTVFGPTQRAVQTPIFLGVPFTTTEMRIAYLDVDGNIIGVFQQPLTEGVGEVSIDDPNFVDLNNFVASISFTDPSLSLEVGEQTQTVVTATLIDNSVADVSTMTPITSSQVSVATVDNGIVLGVAEGQASLTASLFARTDTQAVTVTPATP